MLRMPPWIRCWPGPGSRSEVALRLAVALGQWWDWRGGCQVSIPVCEVAGRVDRGVRVVRRESGSLGAVSSADLAGRWAFIPRPRRRTGPGLVPGVADALGPAVDDIAEPGPAPRARDGHARCHGPGAWLLPVRRLPWECCRRRLVQRRLRRRHPADPPSKQLGRNLGSIPRGIAPHDRGADRGRGTSRRRDRLRGGAARSRTWATWTASHPCWLDGGPGPRAVRIQDAAATCAEASRPGRTGDWFDVLAGLWVLRAAVQHDGRDAEAVRCGR